MPGYRIKVSIQGLAIKIEGDSTEWVIGKRTSLTHKIEIMNTWPNQIEGQSYVRTRHGMLDLDPASNPLGAIRDFDLYHAEDWDAAYNLCQTAQAAKNNTETIDTTITIKPDARQQIVRRPHKNIRII